MKAVNVTTEFKHEGERTLCVLRAQIEYDRVDAAAFRMPITVDWGAHEKFAKKVEVTESGIDPRPHFSVTFRAVVSPKNGDTYDREAGEAIAASRAKIKLARYMANVNEYMSDVIERYRERAERDHDIYFKAYCNETVYLNEIGGGKAPAVKKVNE